jgi:acyl carrier protein
MAIIKFLVELEAEFGIIIGDDEILMPGFTTVGGLVDLVVAKMR